jgi:hypothetical protein
MIKTSFHCISQDQIQKNENSLHCTIDDVYKHDDDDYVGWWDTFFLCYKGDSIAITKTSSLNNK